MHAEPHESSGGDSKRRRTGCTSAEPPSSPVQPADALTVQMEGAHAPLLPKESTEAAADVHGDAAGLIQNMQQPPGKNAAVSDDPLRDANVSKAQSVERVGVPQAALAAAEPALHQGQRTPLHPPLPPQGTSSSDSIIDGMIGEMLFTAAAA
jgi:hypothetical protein